MPYVYKHRRPPEPWHEYRSCAKHPVLLPFFMTEFGAEWIAYGLSQWSFLEVLEYAGSFSILIAVIFYFAESDERRQSRHFQAWQVINTAQGKGGSGGRIDALARLNDDHVPLVGVDVSGAFLQGVRLEKALLQRSDFSAADLRKSRLRGANLEFAEMAKANLRNADLRGTVLHGADLEKADLVESDLSGADLSHVTLDGADLSDADLSGVKNWREKTSVEGANIHGVKNSPEGFVAWALANKAVDGQRAVATTEPGPGTGK